MIKNRKKIIIGVVILLVILFFFFLSFIPAGRPNPKQNPTSTPTETGEPGITTIKRTVYVVKVFPEESLKTQFLPIQQIEITFSDMVDSQDLEVIINPSVNIKIANSEANPSTIIVSPDPIWKVGLTEIRIKKFNKLGERILGNDFIYRLNTSYPKNPPNAE